MAPAFAPAMAPVSAPGFDRDDRRLALAITAVGVASAASLGVFYAVGEPFGTLNDVTGAVLGGLSGLFAWRVRHRVRWGPTTRLAATGAALAGAAIVVTGAGLVVTATTGWYLAGLVSTLGWACLGLWAIALNVALRTYGSVPPRLGTMGIVAGALMAAGFVTLPAIVGRVDDPAAAPAWASLGYLGWLGALLFLGWAAIVSRLDGDVSTAESVPA